MPAPSLPPLSEFGKAAVNLDGQLIQFEALAGELDRLPLDTDKGFERALAIMTEITECRERIEAGMRALSKTLNDTRARHEQTEALVQARAAVVETRRQAAETLFSRFSVLGDMVRQINDKVMNLRNVTASEMSEADRTEMISHLPALDERMDVLVNEAKKLMDDARDSNMAYLEKNVDALRKSLTSARNRIHLFVQKQIPKSATN